MMGGSEEEKEEEEEGRKSGLRVDIKQALLQTLINPP